SQKLVATQPAVVRENRRNGARDGPAGKLGLFAGVKVGEQSANDLEWEVVVALHGEHEAQAFDVGLGELAVARLGAGGGDEVAVLEKAQLRGREVGKLGGESGEHLPNGKEAVRF